MMVATQEHPAPRPPRISQRERRESAERKILDAAVSILIEHGYAATTTLEVQKKSGISRGVLLHYYGSRSELISAAARHLYGTRIGEVRLRAAESPGTATQDWALELWRVISGPVGLACLELLVAARHDPEMQRYLEPLEREFGRANLELCSSLLGEERAAHARFREFCLVVVNSMFGAAAVPVAQGGPEEKNLLQVWRNMPNLYFTAPAN